MQKRKTEKKGKETISSPPPPPTKNAIIPETEAEDQGKEQRKEKKRKKTASKKRAAKAKVPFEPLILETQITISTLEESTMFAIQSTEEKFHPDLDRDLSDVKTEAREVLPMVSRKYICKEAWVGLHEGQNF